MTFHNLYLWEDMKFPRPSKPNTGIIALYINLKLIVHVIVNLSCILVQLHKCKIHILIKNIQSTNASHETYIFLQEIFRLLLLFPLSISLVTVKDVRLMARIDLQGKK